MKRTRLRTDPDKLRAWQKRSQAKLRLKGGLRKSWLNPINRTRASLRKLAHFGAKADWARRQPCSTCGAPPPSQASHALKSRGASGTAYHVIPQCAECHRLVHQGVETFQKLKNCDLEQITRDCHERFLRDRKESSRREADDLAF